MSYKKYEKTLRELQKLARELKLEYCKENPYEVDLERVIENQFKLKIDIIPTASENGIEAYLNLAASTIFIDIALADNPKRTTRYRFTLAEELAHYILHRDIDLYRKVTSEQEYFSIYQTIPEIEVEALEKNARQLAGMILMPEAKFLERLAFHRDARLKVLPKPISSEASSVIMSDVVKHLMDDFVVNEGPVRYVIRELSRLNSKDYFSLSAD